MRIAFIVNAFPSISQTFILDQITGLIDRGHEIHIFAGGIETNGKVHDDILKYDLAKKTYYFPNLPSNKFDRALNSLLHSIKFIPNHLVLLLNSLNFFKHGRMASSLYLMHKLVPFLQHNSYDIIHCHFGPNGNLAVRLKELGLFKGRIITTFYGYDLTSYIKRHNKNIYADLFNKGDLILSISSDFKKRLIKLGCAEENIRIHHLGINSEKFKFRSIDSDNYSKSFCILSIARLVEKKGIVFGIDAVRKLLPKFPNIKYLIAGDGPLRHELSDYIRVHKLDANVELLGTQKQKDILKLIEKANIFLAPSVTSKSGDEEGTPVAIMEALASGVPVVSSYHSGIPELVIQERTGLLANESDAYDIASKIDYALQNPERIKKMAVEGRKHIEMNYSISKLNDKLVDIYSEFNNK